MNIFENLNPSQELAVRTTHGSYLVIAGAGSGKTRVLTMRIANLIESRVADPFQILALTFTNKAAKEMRERIEKVIGNEAKNLWMGTFHSIFAKILRFEAEKIGYSSSFTIYDALDTQNLVKTIVKERKLDEQKDTFKQIYYAISNAKNQLITPKEYQNSHIEDKLSEKVAQVYSIYADRCFKANAMDFDDLLMKPVELFSKFPDILKKYQNRFQFILIDEFQDTNYAQYLIARMLSQSHGNLFVVGDDAQSIYAFRGADIGNILNFQRDFPNTETIKLEQNYRSTQNIVNAANHLIRFNKNQLPKTVYTENNSGEKIQLLVGEDEYQEARKVVDKIRELRMRHNLRDSEIGVLYRTNAQSRVIEDGLRKANISYKIFGGLSFYQRKEIKDVMAYMRLAVNQRDEESLKRVINYPTRGIGKTTMEKIMAVALQNDVTIWQVIQNAQKVGFGARQANSMEKFCNMILSFSKVIQTKNAHEAAMHIAKQSGILKELYNENTLEGKSRWENVQELLNAAQAFVDTRTEEEDNSLTAFLNDIALMTDQDKGEELTDYVSLMSIHMSKGLEFRAVFLIGLEEGLFPNDFRINSRKDLEEERRLFYVAVTRAKEFLHISRAKRRMRFGMQDMPSASRFLAELPEELVDQTAKNISHQFSNRNTNVIGNRPRPSEKKMPKKHNLKPIKRLPKTNPNFTASDTEKLEVGMSIMHQKFGKGEVIAIDGDGAQKKAKVRFHQTNSEKILLLKYAKIQILD